MPRVFATGRASSALATLEVGGRTSGKPVRLPVVIADLDGERYLVPMLGDANWVRHVRAAGGRAVLLQGRRMPVRLDELPIEHRAPVIKIKRGRRGTRGGEAGRRLPDGAMSSRHRARFVLANGVLPPCCVP